MTGSTASAKVLQFHRGAARPKAIASVERNGFASDIFHNPEIHPPIWHFIITRLDNAEILYWGQEPSLEQAQLASQSMIAGLSAKDEAVG